ncbi:MAG: hypothetical protein HKM24_05265, partial [Gammaproteobacteria bacterium]|nr:hypothetical protein [Gammaproteobacteria bacterium]
MKHLKLIAISLLVFAWQSPSFAQNCPADVSQLTAGHWCEVPNSNVSALDPEDDPAVNPNYPGGAPWRGVEGQSAIMNDWVGGGFDTLRNRLFIMGGGHDGYAGNEVYVFDVAS